MDCYKTELYTASDIYNWGRDTIDGIFVSNELSIAAGEYLVFGDLLYDHRRLCI